MKIRNWNRKLAAALVAGGLMAPAAAHAAPTGVNLVVNPGFENVDLTTTAYYNAPRILDWTAPSPIPGSGFAYSHDLSGASVPDFANGTLASGGHWYFTPGNFAIGTGAGHDSLANAISQNIDVSTGPTATAIATGAALFNLSAYFSTYGSQPDRGVVRVTFQGAADVELGFAEVATPPATVLQNWTQFSTSGSVPLGTLTLNVRSWGIASSGSADGYTDNIDLRIVPEPSAGALGAAGAAALGAIRRRKRRVD
jgi:MYXO-CTERM domain-containing protein